MQRTMMQIMCDKNIELVVLIQLVKHTDDVEVAADADKVGRVSTVTNVSRNQGVITATASNRGSVSAIQAGPAPTATAVQ